MKELFSIRSKQFSAFDWREGPYKGYKGRLIEEGLIRSVSGGFGDFLFQGRPGEMVSTWDNDYVIKESFEAHARLDQELIEASLIMTGRPEHSRPNCGWNFHKRFTTNLTYANCMDHKTRFEAGMHYASFDIHIDIKLIYSLLPDIPELVTPFLTAYEKKQPFNLFTLDTPATKEVCTLFGCLRTVRAFGQLEDTITYDFARMLIKQLFLLHASITQRRGLTKEQEEAVYVIREIATMIELDGGMFRGINFYSRKAGMSNTRFKNAFKAVMGMPPGKYSLEQRLAGVQSKLLYSDDKLQDIAIEFGFSSYRTLNKAFRAKFGEPPSRLRNPKLGNRLQ